MGGGGGQYLGRGGGSIWILEGQYLEGGGAVFEGAVFGGGGQYLEGQYLEV